MKKLLLFCKPGIEVDDKTPQDFIQVSVYGAVIIPNDEEPCQDFIDAAWAEGIQLASYDFYPEDETHQEWDPQLFANGKQIADKLNNLIMAQFN